MKFIGNLIWLIFGGILVAIEYFVASLLLMITIIGIPFGIQTMKLGILALWPFGSEVRSTPAAGGCLYTLMNVIWILIFVPNCTGFHRTARYKYCGNI